jgi:hypothetical protein
VNIILQHNQSILSTMNRKYDGSLKFKNNAKSIEKSNNISGKEDLQDTTNVRQEQSNDMQVHFGQISSNMKSVSIREPDIRILTNKLQEEFSNIQAVSGENVAVASSSNAIDGNNFLSSDQLMDSFVDCYSKNYEQYLTVFASRQTV